MIQENDFTPEQQELYELMSDISEDCYYAGWMVGNEHAIWGALQDGNRRYGMGEMDLEQLERVRELSNKLGGWVIWWDDDNDPGLDVSEWGPRFVTLDHWKQIMDSKA